MRAIPNTVQWVKCESESCRNYTPGDRMILLNGTYWVLCDGCHEAARALAGLGDTPFA